MKSQLLQRAADGAVSRNSGLGASGSESTVDMSDVIKWQGSAVDVQARLVPRYLWNTASVDVFLDGQRILRTGGQFKFTGSYSTTFTRAGSTHKAELSWGLCGLSFSFPYRLQIDGAPVAD
jgi:hypothetical protein